MTYMSNVRPDPVIFYSGRHAVADLPHGEEQAARWRDEAIEGVSHFVLFAAFIALVAMGLVQAAIKM